MNLKSRTQDKITEKECTVLRVRTQVRAGCTQYTPEYCTCLWNECKAAGKNKFQCSDELYAIKDCEYLFHN